MAISTFWASCSIDFCSSKTLLYGMIGSLHPPFIILGGGWIKIGGWFVLLGVCSLWRSDIYEILLSRPVSPLIVQGSARLSPGDIGMIIDLCGKGTGCEYFLGIVPDLLFLGELFQPIRRRHAWNWNESGRMSGRSCPSLGSNWSGRFF